MDTKPLETLAARIESVMGDDKPYEVSRKLALRGVEVSPQAIYGWLKGGEVKEANLQAFAELYEVEPAWLRYGVGDRESRRQSEEAIVHLFKEMPSETKQLTLDFIEYQLHKATSAIASEKVANYMRFIERIKADMDDKKKSSE